jgi:hypothetical protein
MQKIADQQSERYVGWPTRLPFFQLADANIVSAATERVSGIECLRGRPWPETGKINPTSSE